MLSCRKAAELIHKKHNVGLTGGEKFSLSLHTKMCKACGNFEKQTQYIEKAIEHHLQRDNAQSFDIQKFKEEIISKLT